MDEEQWLTPEQYERQFCDVGPSQKDGAKAPTKTTPEPFSIRSPEASTDARTGLFDRMRSLARKGR